MVGNNGNLKLKSGNILHWRKVDQGGRGGVTGSFRDEPTDEDVSEGQEFIRSLTPTGARVVVDAVVSDENEMRSRMTEHMAHGLCKN